MNLLRTEIISPSTERLYTSSENSGIVYNGVYARIEEVLFNYSITNMYILKMRLTCYKKVTIQTFLVCRRRLKCYQFFGPWVLSFIQHSDIIWTGSRLQHLRQTIRKAIPRSSGLSSAYLAEGCLSYMRRRVSISAYCGAGCL
jgi:hypothetical protein